MTASVLALVMLLGLAGAEDERLARAQKKLKEARQILDDSERALIRTHALLESEYEKVSGPNCPDFLRSLAEVWISLSPEMKAAWDDLVLGGRRPNERRFEDAVALLLSDKAADVTRVHAELITPFRRKATAYIFDALRRGNEIESEGLLEEFRAILTIRTPFHEFWNTHLYLELTEARAFAEANEAFAAAKAAVDRLLYPTEFDERGRRAPPGMVLVQGGIYYVGPNTGWERKRRKAKVTDFYIDKYEVTNKEFNIFLRTLDEAVRPQFMPHFWPKDVYHQQYYPEDRADHPVVGVSWEAANAYALWKGKRLPTEEEWEIAATGGDGRLYPWGDKYKANACNTRETGIGSTVEVGSFPEGASPWGVHDMAGNAEEWTCTDQDGNVVEVLKKTIVNVTIRGGNYKEDATHASCLYRWMTPMNPYEGSRPSKKAIGFRCVQDVR